MRRNRKLDPLRHPLDAERRTAVLNRIKTARGHLDAIVGLIEDDAYVLDILRQVAAVRGALDATIRVALRHYFEHVLVSAVKMGQSKAAIDELMSALTFLKQID